MTKSEIAVSLGVRFGLIKDRAEEIDKMRKDRHETEATAIIRLGEELYNRLISDVELESDAQPYGFDEIKESLENQTSESPKKINDTKILSRIEAALPRAIANTSDLIDGAIQAKNVAVSGGDPAEKGEWWIPYLQTVNRTIENHDLLLQGIAFAAIKKGDLEVGIEAAFVGTSGSTAMHDLLESTIKNLDDTLKIQFIGGFADFDEHAAQTPRAWNI